MTFAWCYKPGYYSAHNNKPTKNGQLYNLKQVFLPNSLSRLIVI